MKDIIYDDFQNTVNEVLIRHKSILDIITKFQETDARINRAIAKSATLCGCIKIKAEKQKIPEDISLQDMIKYVDYQLEGQICDNCREVIEKEIGNHIFYLTALCNALDLNLYDIFLKEYKKLSTLGIYNLL